MKAFKIISIVLVLAIILYFIYKYFFKSKTVIFDNSIDNISPLDSIYDLPDTPIKRQKILIIKDEQDIGLLKKAMNTYRKKSEEARAINDTANMSYYDGLYNEAEINLNIAEDLLKVHKNYLKTL